MKRILTITLIFVALVLLAVWSPWLRWNIDLGALIGVTKPESIAGLQVSSLAGELEIFLDGHSEGKVTPENSPYFVYRVEPGEHLLTIKRTGEFADTYSDFSKLIDFITGSTVVVAYNLGPDEQFSEGHIIYATKKGVESSNSKLNINVSTENFNFSIDGVPAERITGENVSTNLDLNSQHRLKISKTGYEPLEFTILPETQEDRDKIKFFDLNIDVQLMLQPVEVNTI